MFRFITILAALVGSAAFAPVARVARGATDLQAKKRPAPAVSDFRSEIGAQAPLGFWDPLGLLADADQARFDRLREVEVKHGRISQLAILGHLVTTAGYRLPGAIDNGFSGTVAFADVRSGLAAFEDLPIWYSFQFFISFGLLEYGFSLRKADIEAAQIEASGWDEATLNKKLAIELNNGRAAQMGILALMVHEKLDNNPYIINSLLGSPVPFNQ